MNNDTSYDDLLKQYRELQLRVTRFSVVEQQLINTRDRLDHELVMYKRLSNFNVDALNESKECAFFKLVAETIVDVFEVESGIAHVRNYDDNGGMNITMEGLQIDSETRNKLSEEISELGQHSPQGVVLNIKDLDLSNYQTLKLFAGGLYYQYSDLETNHTYTLMGLISKHNSPLYNSIEERHLSFFNVFINQVFSIASNRKKSEKINQQIDRISRSELELKKLSMIATKTRNGVVIANSEGKIEWVNDAFSTITGYSIDEVKGLKPGEFLQKPDVDKEVQEAISVALKKQEGIEVTIQNFTKKGVPYFNNLQITPIFNEDGVLLNYIAIQRDITKEKKYQEDLLHINSKFELITTKAYIGIWEWNAETNETYWNEVLLDQFGFEPGTSFVEIWKKQVISEDYPMVKQALINLYEGDSDQEHVEYRVLRKKDGSLRNLDSLTIAERDQNGKLQRLIGNLVDVTETRKWQSDVLKKNDELKKINAELDNFVYRVSHDLRSPLLAIKGIFSLIFSGNGIDEETEEYLKLADSSVNRLDDTIQEILEYSRNSRLAVKIEEFDVAEIVKNIYEDLKFSADKEVDFRMDIEGSSIINSDMARMKVLFKNLIGNSFKYRNKKIDNAFIHFEMKYVDQHIIFKVIDNGEGISEHSLGKVFDMFYRGTTSSVGTGLGLYICKEVLTNLNGKIEVDSKLGKGTTMTVTLPIAINTK
jgi:PAS domain S-box-containing protein